MSPLQRLSSHVRKVREYGELSDAGDIARRYFAMNAFDGVLTMIGVLVGCYVARVAQSGVVLAAGLSTGMALCVSGVWGAALTEAAERKRSLCELQEATLSNLQDTKVGKASRMAVVVITLTNSIAPAAAAAIILSPFLLAGLVGNILLSYYLSLGLALASLFALGLFLGHVSRSSLPVYGLKTVSAGVVSVAIGLVLSLGAI